MYVCRTVPVHHWKMATCGRRRMISHAARTMLGSQYQSTPSYGADTRRWLEVGQLRADPGTAGVAAARAAGGAS